MSVNRGKLGPSKQPECLKLDNLSTAPELVLLSACREHKIHVPCQDCGDCVGGLGNGFRCRPCEIHKLAGWADPT